MLQTQLKSLKESCTSLKWGRSQQMLQEEKQHRAGTGQGFKAEALAMPLVLKTPLK